MFESMALQKPGSSLLPMAPFTLEGPVHAQDLHLQPVAKLVPEGQAISRAMQIWVACPAGHGVIWA